MEHIPTLTVLYRHASGPMSDGNAGYAPSPLDDFRGAGSPAIRRMRELRGGDGLPALQRMRDTAATPNGPNFEVARAYAVLSEAIRCISDIVGPHHPLTRRLEAVRAEPHDG